MKDRVPTPGKENRVKITQDDGTVLEGVLSYADDATVEGSTYTKANVLPDGLCDQLAISREEAEPKDAFTILATIADGKSRLIIKCVDNNGVPIDGCIAQIGNVVARSNLLGLSVFYLTPGGHDISVRAPIDYGAGEQVLSVSLANGESAIFTVVFEDTTGGDNELRITSSIPYVAFSKRVASADAFGVGGGGSGGVGVSPDNACAATGGAGGYTATAFGFDSTSILSVTLGAGGEKKGATNVTESVKAGAKGGTTEIVDAQGNTILSAPGGAGGKAASIDFANCAGANGGSGSGGAYNYQVSGGVNGKYAFVGDSGEDGANGNGAGFPNNASNGPGGTGQGSSTRLFGEADGEMFSSAGASAGSMTSGSTDGYFLAGQPGTGGGTALVIHSAEAGNAYSAGDAETYGSGGGAIVGYINEVKIDIFGGAGKQGLVVFRWELGT